VLFVVVVVVLPFAVVATMDVAPVTGPPIEPAEIPFVVVVLVPEGTAVATLVVGAATAFERLELIMFASWVVNSVVEPKGAMKVGLTLSVVDALPAITVTCDGSA